MCVEVIIMRNKKSIFLLVGSNDDLRKQVMSAFPPAQTFFASIADQVNNVSGYLLRGNTNPDYDHVAIRTRGYKVNPLYWLNLLLSSVNGEHTYIVVTDAQNNDVSPGTVVLYIGNGQVDKDSHLGLNLTTVDDPCTTVKNLLGQ